MAEIQGENKLLEEEPCGWDWKALGATTAHHAVQVTAIGILNDNAEKVLGTDERLWLHYVRMMK